LSAEETITSGILPSNIIFSGSIFTITPSIVGPVDLNLVATDSLGATTTEVFNIWITNTIPTNITGVDDLVRYNNTEISLTYDFSTIFYDPEVSNNIQTFTYSVLSVPVFLSQSWDGDILLLKGNATDVDVETYSISLKAYDGYQAKVVTFQLDVLYNYPPNASNVFDIEIIQKVPITVDLNDFTYLDLEEDTLTFDLLFDNGTDLSNANWISFDPVTLELTINALSVDYTIVPMEFIIDDSFNTPVSFSFNIYIDNQPKLNPLVYVRSGQFIATHTSNFTIDKDLFYDEDAVLAYSLSKLSIN